MKRNGESIQKKKKKRIEMWIKCKNRKNKKREGGRKRKEE